MARNLPEEVVIEILSWLPVKSLLRFRCVSKTWLHWFSSDSQFIELHLHQSKHKNPGIIVSPKKPFVERTQLYYAEDCTSRDKPICLEIPFGNPHYTPPDDFTVVNICNGLICLTDFDDSNDSNVYVWNPLTRDHVIIPVPPLPSQFCDRETDRVFGFGFDRCSNEYKVLCFVSVDVSEAFEFTSDVSVYTLGTGSWRSLGDIMDYSISLCWPSAALVNGALHWFATKARPNYVRDVLVSFDLNDEGFREIPQPQYIQNEEYIIYYVRELSGFLCIFRSKAYGMNMELWMLKEYGVVDSWSKQFDIEGFKIPVSVVNNGEFVLLENGDDCQLILYNSKTNAVRPLNSFGFRVCYKNAFSGSLLSLTMINNSKHSLA